MLGHKLGPKVKYEKVPVIHSRGISFELKIMKLNQNINPGKIKMKIETGLCWVKN